MAFLSRHMPFMPMLELPQSASNRNIGIAPWAIVGYPAITGGTTFTVSALDSIALSNPTLVKPDYKVLGPDAIALSDSFLRLTSYFRACLDAVGLSDSTLRICNSLRIVADACGLSDSPLRKSDAIRNVTDAIAYADTPLRQSDALRNVVDGCGLSDTPAFITNTKRAVVDSVGLSDLLSFKVSYMRIVLDAVALGDTCTIVAVGAGTQTIVVTDALGLATTVYEQVDYKRAITDSAGLSTTVSISGAYSRAITDAIGASSVTTNPIGPNSPSTAANVSHGDVAWNNPNNAKVADGSNADVLLDEIVIHSDYLRVTNFGTLAPSGGTVTGVLLEIKRSGSTSSAIKDHEVELRKADGSVSDSKATADAWPTTAAYASYGGPNDIWGFASLSASEVNNSGFGAQLSAARRNFFGGTAFVDHMRLTVYCAAEVLVQVQYYRAISDALGISDTLVKTVAYARAITDSLGLSDTVARQVAYARLVLDAVALGDTFSRTVVTAGASAGMIFSSPVINVWAAGFVTGERIIKGPPRD